MTTKQNFTKSRQSKELKSRINRVIRALKKNSTSASLIVSSGTRKTLSRDLHYHFRQDSDFFYLTGSHDLEKSSLVISTDGAVTLVAPKISELELLWEGPRETARQVARRIGATLITTKNHQKELKELISESASLFYPNTPGQPAYDLARSILAIPAHQRGEQLNNLSHIGAILEPLRLIKSRYEVECIQEAARVTAESLMAIHEYIKPGIREKEIAIRLEAEFQLRGAEVAFPSIVGAEKNGATLHHSPSTRKLRNKELLLIDCGARMHGYAADITRAFIIGDSPSQKVLDLVQVVTEVEERIIQEIKPGVRWRTLFNNSCEYLLKGLRELKLISGSLAKHRKSNTVRQYFPHSLGHALGIDVHDVGPLRALSDTKLEMGMVLTIEPGLYLPKGLKSLPPCGVRIEDDILVTRTGARNLTGIIPKLNN